mmetsp:Transcript_1516/g.4534  ORF Transcript_1516/g.4534 Transcript_1516/m.4534 type:complete len:434 (-) Transcript_1516:112-1413(-)
MQPLHLLLAASCATAFTAPRAAAARRAVSTRAAKFTIADTSGPVQNVTATTPQKIAIPPTEDQTGVSIGLTRTCATFASQMYDVASGERPSFDLTGAGGAPPEIVIDDIQHDDMLDGIATAPPFAVALKDKTLIACWRGSVTMSDWVEDIGFAPCLSASWYAAAEGLRCHGGFTALVESDITKHEAAILGLVKKHGCTQLIFTGHSLAGGMAQLGNFVVSGRMLQPTSPWYEVKDALEIRTVAYASPVAIQEVTANKDAATKAFVEDVASRSCNIIAEQDLVPRLGTGLTFTDDFMEDVVPAIAGSKIPASLYWILDGKDRVDSVYEGAKDAPFVKQFWQAGGRMRYPGTIIAYKDAAAEPVLLVDKGNDGTKPGELAHYGYIKLEKKRKGWLRWAASSTVGRGGSSYEYLEDPITREVDLHDLGIFGLQYDN